MRARSRTHSRVTSAMPSTASPKPSPSSARWSTSQPHLSFFFVWRPTTSPTCACGLPPSASATCSQRRARPDARQSRASVTPGVRAPRAPCRGAPTPSPEEACSGPSDRVCRRSSPSSQRPSNPGSRFFEIGDQSAVRGRLANGDGDGASRSRMNSPTRRPPGGAVGQTAEHRIDRYWCVMTRPFKGGLLKAGQVCGHVKLLKLGACGDVGCAFQLPGGKT